MGAYIFVSVLILIVCILLILVVIVQNSKGGGLASNFSSSNQIMGVRKTTDFLEKATWTLSIILLVLSMLSIFVIPRNVSTTVKGTELQEQIESTAVAPSNYQAPPAKEE
ncbi:MAG TPA: preprotein translocase subunit SecG [Bacteroidales bacterium]|nr:preprotein translocase subunit SecG [Bacteroidales bacterium]